MGFLPDADHSPYRALLTPMTPNEGSLDQELLKLFPDHQKHGVLCVDEYYPLVSAAGVTWVYAGIIDIYPGILYYLDKWEWLVTPKPEDITDEMKRIQEGIIASEPYQAIFGTSQV